MSHAEQASPTHATDLRPALTNVLNDLREYLLYQQEESSRTVAANPSNVAALSQLPAAAGTQPPAAIERKVSARVGELEPGRPGNRPGVGPAPATATSKDGDPQVQLAEIARQVEACRKCSLGSQRTKSVPGQGNPRPEILFVGEAPGADEDRSGLAFVGRAGQLLTKMIEAMGYMREEVFIANIAKCRPPDNRPPLPEEMAACIPYLKAQIALLKPKVIVALGATAVKGMMNLEQGITKLRGKWLLFDGIQFMPTYHPSYLLRNPSAKKEVWEDLQEVLRFLGRKPPSRDGNPKHQAPNPKQ